MANTARTLNPTSANPIKAAQPKERISQKASDHPSGKANITQLSHSAAKQRQSGPPGDGQLRNLPLLPCRSQPHAIYVPLGYADAMTGLE